MNRWETPWGLTPSQLLEKWKHVVDAGSGVFTWTSPEELSALAELASRSTSICEIGSYHGRSALTMALANPACKILCIDNCENGDVRHVFAENLRDQLGTKQVDFIKGTSRIMRLAEDSKFDACFIDGGHLEQDVVSDIGELKAVMSSGSIMVGHDYRQNDMNDGVNKAVHAHFGKPEWVFQSLWMVRLP